MIVYDVLWDILLNIAEFFNEKLGLKIYLLAVSAAIDFYGQIAIERVSRYLIALP